MNHSQQSMIFDPRLAQPVTVIGAGSVGSHVALYLAQLGCADITVYDHDFVESHNIPMSVYRACDLGRYKVQVLQEIVQEKTGTKIKIVQKKYEGERLKTAVVCCVDWMDERLMVWPKVDHNPFVPLFVDTRVAEEFIVVYRVRPCQPEDCAEYTKALYPSSEANRPMCGKHGIITTSVLAAGIAVASLKEHWSGRTVSGPVKLLAGNLERI